MSKSKVSYDSVSAAPIDGDDKVFQCSDESGNGCGRIFDGNVVSNNGGLCPDCAADVVTNEGC